MSFPEIIFLIIITTACLFFLGGGLALQVSSVIAALHGTDTPFRKPDPEPEAEHPALSISKRGPWTAEDQAALKAFWASTAGQHLRDQLTYSEMHRFADVVHGKNGDSTELLRGRALGYQRLLQDLHTLATGPAYDPDLAKADAEPSAEA